MVFPFVIMHTLADNGLIFILSGTCVCTRCNGFCQPKDKIFSNNALLKRQWKSQCKYNRLCGDRLSLRLVHATLVLGLDCKIYETACVVFRLVFCWMSGNFCIFANCGVNVGAGEHAGRWSACKQQLGACMNVAFSRS